ncbi:MAG TPA: HEPN domain-containing protein [Gammaproteobacteria bacterium]|nr:HEPN domain-containing protein [Gammaproteobacteria bacterium]
MTKARRALASSRLLLTEEDADGTCNRAYYAMFDASRAALIASGFEEIAITTKTYSGLISAFSLHLVKTGRLSKELGRSLNKVEDIRLMADYLGVAVDLEQAAWSLKQASIFVEVIEKIIFTDRHNTIKSK